MFQEFADGGFGIRCQFQRVNLGIGRNFGGGDPAVGVNARRGDLVDFADVGDGDCNLLLKRDFENPCRRLAVDFDQLVQFFQRVSFFQKIPYHLLVTLLTA